MGRIYFMIFWIPAVAAATMLWAAGHTGLLRRPGLLSVVFLLAFLLQFFAVTLSPRWAAGLVLQVVLAIYLAIRIKLG